MQTVPSPLDVRATHHPIPCSSDRPSYQQTPYSQEHQLRLVTIGYHRKVLPHVIFLMSMINRKDFHHFSANY